MDNSKYIEFLEETLMSETSYNNILVNYNEDGIVESIAKAINWICQKIRDICSFIVKVVKRAFTAIIGLFSRKKKDDSVISDEKVEVPKAVGFANQIMNDMNVSKFKSICYSKHDRSDDINNRKQKIIENCVKCRETTKEIPKKVAVNDAVKFEEDSKKASNHINTLDEQLRQVENELKNKQPTPELQVQIKNTTAMLAMVSSVLGEYMKTISHYKKLYNAVYE